MPSARPPCRWRTCVQDAALDFRGHRVGCASAWRQAPGLGGGHCLPCCARLLFPAVGAVGMCFLFSETEACGLPAPLKWR